MIGDISVYHNSSANKQIDSTAVSLGFDFLFANMIVTPKTTDIEGHIAELSRSCAERNGILELGRAPKRSSIVDFVLKSSKPDGQPSLAVLSRVTLVLQNADRIDDTVKSLISKLANDVRIDCVCLRPSNEGQLMELITNRTTFHYDLLSIDVSSGHFFQQIGTVTRAMKTGKDEVIIELEMSQLFRNSTGSGTEVTNVVNQARMALRRAPGLVVSSGAKSAFEMRSPLDLVNWGEGVLGLKAIKKNLKILFEQIVKKRMIRGNVPDDSRMSD